MTKSEFKDFIKEIGFDQVWQTNPNYFMMPTDVVGTFQQKKLSIHLNDDNELAHLSSTQAGTHMVTGENFGQFDLRTFGDLDDFQMQIFMSFVKGAFKNPPYKVVQYMRDKSIVDILNNP